MDILSIDMTNLLYYHTFSLLPGKMVGGHVPDTGLKGLIWRKIEELFSKIFTLEQKLILETKAINPKSNLKV